MIVVSEAIRDAARRSRYSWNASRRAKAVNESIFVQSTLIFFLVHVLSRQDHG
jgi:hypothetical protein